MIQKKRIGVNLEIILPGLKAWLHCEILSATCMAVLCCSIASCRVWVLHYTTRPQRVALFLAVINWGELDLALLGTKQKICAEKLKLEKLPENSAFPNYAPLLTNKASKSTASANF